MGRYLWKRKDLLDHNIFKPAYHRPLFKGIKHSRAYSSTRQTACQKRKRRKQSSLMLLSESHHGCADPCTYDACPDRFGESGKLMSPCRYFPAIPTRSAPNMLPGKAKRLPVPIMFLIRLVVKAVPQPRTVQANTGDNVYRMLKRKAFGWPHRNGDKESHSHLQVSLQQGLFENSHFHVFVFVHIKHLLGSYQDTVILLRVFVKPI